MTVVVYKDGKIASDSRATADETIVSEKVIKTAVGPGVIGGGSGDATELAPFLKWIKEGADLESIPVKNKVWGLVAYSRGRRPPRVIKVEDGGYYDTNLDRGEFFACGAGREVALGALEMGATAEEAALAAIKYVTTCGGKVQIVEL